MQPKTARPNVETLGYYQMSLRDGFRCIPDLVLGIKESLTSPFKMSKNGPINGQISCSAPAPGSGGSDFKFQTAHKIFLLKCSLNADFISSGLVSVG